MYMGAYNTQVQTDEIQRNIHVQTQNKHTHKNSQTKRKHKYFIHKKIHTQDTYAHT